MQNIEISKLELEILINWWDETSLLTIHSDIFEFFRTKSFKRSPRERFGQKPKNSVGTSLCGIFFGYFRENLNRWPRRIGYKRLGQNSYPTNSVASSIFLLTSGITKRANAKISAVSQSCISLHQWAFHAVLTNEIEI